MSDLALGTTLRRIKDGALYTVAEHEGGVQDWYRLVPVGAGRTVSVSRSGIDSKYETVSTTTRVSGHALMNEGAAFRDEGERENFGRYVLGTGGAGRAKCSCGELSDPLPTSTARRAWHREHKAAQR